MNIEKLIIFLLGFSVGVFILTYVPTVNADSNEVHNYLKGLNRIISLMEQMQVTSQETAENTKSIKEKLGAK